MSFISREVKPYFEKSIEPFVEFLSRKNVRPNHITVAGLLLVGAGSLFLYTGFTLPSLILLGAGALLDAVDGSLARKTDSHSEFG
ncbi:MAG TPA: CDP-alcohol phosphatidyltransferase family protein, partial [Aquifex aeolicus]|nr:CDP-alcohol phosphatidyltransferase family protein [Aquifex aeolicus]